MGFVDKHSPVWRDVPGEPGCEFGFAVLSGGEMDEAQVRAIERTLEMNISEGMSKALLKAPEGKGDDDKPVEYRDCNDGVLVEYGVVGWRGGPYEGRPCDTANRKLLTAKPFKWAARTAFDLSVLTAGEDSTSVPSGRDGGASVDGHRGAPSPTSTPGASSLAPSG